MVETQLPSEFANASGMWLFEAGSFAAWLCFFMFFLRQSIHAGTLSLGLLLLISTTSMFWQEFYGDWAVYILYNPKFTLIPWGTTFWTTPNKPWMVIPAYGWFFTSVYLVMFWMIAKLRTWIPKLGRAAAVLVAVVPTLYVWDLVVEGGAALLGWWSYVHCFGPAIVSSKGSFPLFYPILVLVLYGVVGAFVLSLRGPDGRVRFESWFGVERIRDGVSREFARIGAWILTMNVLYLAIMITPIIVVRELFGVPSDLVP